MFDSYEATATKYANAFTKGVIDEIKRVRSEILMLSSRLLSSVDVDGIVE
jgi:hypothetical protein